MRFSTSSFAILALAAGVRADFYIAGVGGEWEIGGWGYPATANDQGVTFGEKLECGAFGSAGGLPDDTDNQGRLTYHFCDVDGVSFSFKDQCNGHELVIGGTGNRCGQACSGEDDCNSSTELGLLFDKTKGDMVQNVGTCWYAGKEGWSENCASNGSHEYSELVYCYIDPNICGK